MKSTNNLLLFASLLAFAGAIIQAVIGFVPKWSAAVGAGEALTSNPPLLLALGLLMALVFAVCGLYGLSGAGLIRRLPLLRLGLFAIGLVCALNGVPLLFQLPVVLGLRPAPQPIPISFVISSLVFLTVGLGYLTGLAVGWKRLGRQAIPAAA
jgi:putative oxidoreductase